MKVIAAMCLAVCLVGCVTVSDSRLSGSFSSDKEATLEDLRAKGTYTSEQLERLSKLFGRTKMTFSKDRVVIEKDGARQEVKLNIVRTTSKYTLVEWTALGVRVQQKLTFVNDGYWAETTAYGTLREPFREKFRRMGVRRQYPK